MCFPLVAIIIYKMSCISRIIRISKSTLGKITSSYVWTVRCLIFSVPESLRSVQPPWSPRSVHGRHCHLLTQRTMSFGKICNTISPYPHRCPAWAAAMPLWHFPKKVLKAHTEALPTTFFTYIFICSDIDLEWVLWETVAAAQRLWGNERCYPLTCWERSLVRVNFQVNFKENTEYGKGTHKWPGFHFSLCVLWLHLLTFLNLTDFSIKEQGGRVMYVVLAYIVLINLKCDCACGGWWVV